MNIGIVGSRGYTDYQEFCVYMNDYLCTYDIDNVISGGAKGTDTLAKKWAIENTINLIEHLPDWSIGKRGAVLRNLKIVEDSDMIIAFWDYKSKGTKMTIDMAKRKNKKVVINKINYL